MTVSGPYDHYAGIYPRRNEYIDLIIKNRPEVRSYRVWVSKKLDDLYGDPDTSGVGGDESNRKMIFEVLQGTHYRSNTIKRKGLGAIDNYKGSTKALFWLQDFWEAQDPQPLPLGDSMCFLSIQEVRRTTGPVEVQGVVNNGDPILGPILIIPPSITFGSQSSIISVSGTAPVVSNVESGVTPNSILDFDQQTSAPPMAIIFPLATSNTLDLSNLDVSEELYYAFDWGDTFKPLGYEETLSLTGSSFKQIILASATTAIPFKITVTI